MEDFKNEVRKISSDSIERKLEDEKKRNEKIHSAINSLVTLIKNDIKYKASHGDFKIKDDKHYITGCLKWSIDEGVYQLRYFKKPKDICHSFASEILLRGSFLNQSTTICLNYPLLEVNVIRKPRFFIDGKYNFKKSKEEIFVCDNVRKILQKDDVFFTSTFAIRHTEKVVYDYHNCDEFIYNYIPYSMCYFYEYEFVY